MWFASIPSLPYFDLDPLCIMVSMTVTWHVFCFPSIIQNAGILAAILQFWEVIHKLEPAKQSLYQLLYWHALQWLLK